MSQTTSILTGGTNSHQTTAEEANALATDILVNGTIGVITATAGVAPMTGSYAVNALGTPAMTVAVSAGVVYTTAVPASGVSQMFRTKNSATENVTISANATGGTRYDWVYLKIDPTNAANPNVGGTNVGTLVTSRSTSASTDNGTPPTYGTVLAVVTVSNGAVSITNGNIAEKRIDANSVVTADITDSAVTPAKLLAGTGTDWIWATWTPTLSGLFNNGKWTKTCKYVQIGKTVFFRLNLVASTTTPMDGSGEPTFTIPVTSVSDSPTIGLAISTGHLLDTGTAAYSAYIEKITGSTTTARMRYFDSGAAAGSFRAVITTTAPFTWTTGDEFSFQGMYEAA